MKHSGPQRLLVVFVVVLLLVVVFLRTSGSSDAADAGGVGSAAQAALTVSSITATVPSATPNVTSDQRDDKPRARSNWFYSRRTAGDPDFSLAKAAERRAAAASALLAMKSEQPGSQSVSAFGGAWQPIGPDPVVQPDYSRTLYRAVAGRVSALAIRSSPPYTIYLGAAQGGVWVSSTLTSRWIPKTDQLPSLAIGAIALAPSNEAIVYVGTGEGALSLDSYYGNGILKSTDGGNTFTPVSGTALNQVSVSRIVVDPNDPEHLYAATIRGVGGIRAITPPEPTPYGILESTDGGVTWTERRRGSATDLVMDPLQPNVLYASFEYDGIWKTTDGGLTWTSLMDGFQTEHRPVYPWSQVALGISHPSAAVSATLYAGFEWTDGRGYHPSAVWKSTDEGATWRLTNTDVVEGYCGTAGKTQCWYDNVIAVDPTDPEIVFVGGLFDYWNSRGGIFRSMDGGATWTDLGFGQHPDFHAIAIRKDAPQNVVIGNDGGVWASSSYGGRLALTDPYTAVTWVNLNATVDPETGEVLGSSGLQITQFQSVAQHPVLPEQTYGGTQDNGTQRKDLASHVWFDKGGGDGGQVLVDPTNPDLIYGTHYDVSPFRFTDGMLGDFWSQQPIVNGINTSDASEFYIPFAMDPEEPSRLYLGTTRVYRTDDRGDLWQAISPEFGLVTAFGTTAGAPALYVGTRYGSIHVASDATGSWPVWRQAGDSTLPWRPVQAFAVDRSNFRMAYAAYGGFNAATPETPGHVFKTTDGGQTWTDISGNLPDVPVNSLVLDASNPNVLYAGTDVGPLVTSDGGATWEPLGTEFPVVTVFQLDLNPLTRQLVAGTHGRGVWRLRDGTTNVPALQVRARDAGLPVGPGSLLTYTLTVKNLGNAPATGVAVTNPVLANTDFVSAGAGGTLSRNAVVWREQTIPVSGSLSLDFTVRITSSGVVTTGSAITNDGIVVTSAEGVGATGSPLAVTLAVPYALTLRPGAQRDGTRSGQVISYVVELQNNGYAADTYALTLSGNTWPTSLWDATFTRRISQIGPVGGGLPARIGVMVTIPDSAANGAVDTVSLTARARGNSSVAASASIRSTAVTYDVLLVDQDGGYPNVESPYVAALDDNGLLYNQWDLNADSQLPPNYLGAHPVVVWFTGALGSQPLAAYESLLAQYLDNGGGLFLAGSTILDRGVGLASGGRQPDFDPTFVMNYLHVDWESPNTRNDIGTASVTAVPTSTAFGGLGTLPLDHTLLGWDSSDQLALLPPAVPAFVDQYGVPDGLTVVTDRYRVVFLAFAFEALGTAGNRANVMARAIDYLRSATPPNRTIYLPLMRKGP